MNADRRADAGSSVRPSPARTLWRLTAIFLVALLVRLAPLNRYVTPDEPIWVLRSVRFADAVAARDWAAIPQTGHPGATTMALGALGIRLTSVLRPEVTAEHLDWLRNVAWLAPENAAAFKHLAFFLPAGRALVSLVTAAGIAVSYAIARVRLGERTARWLALFLAFDPFFGGLSGLLHTDALQATFILLAVLESLPKRSAASPSWLSLTATALFLALAGLTKTLGLLVAPGVALALLLLSREIWQQRVARIAILTVLTIAFYLIIYPPFWAGPWAALESLIAAASYHESIGLRDVFFVGQVTTDPGPLFYPVVLLFRLTVPVCAGLILAVLDGMRRRSDNAKVPYTGWFLLPVLIYLTAVTFATKKFDRYALSAMVLLTGVAAVAWGRRFTRWKWLLLTALLLPWALVAPLPLYFANPLFGGPWVAQRVIPLGWGENYGIAAAQAARLFPNADTKTVLTANVPGAAPYFSGVTQPWDETRIPCADALIVENTLPSPGGYTAARSPYLAGIPLAVIHTHPTSLSANLPLLLPGPLPGAPADSVAPVADTPTLHDWLAARYPIDKPFLWVHAPDCYPVTEAQLVSLLRESEVADCEPADAVGGFSTERCMLHAAVLALPAFDARFAGTLDLIAASWPETAQAPDAMPVRLRWRAHTPQEAHSIYLALRGTDGDVVWAEGGNELVDDRAWRTYAWETGAFIEGTAYIPLSLSLPPGVYTLTLSLLDGRGGWIGLTLPDGAFSGTLRELGMIEIVPPPYPALELAKMSPLLADFSGVRLIGAASLPETLWSGERLPFRLGWERIPGTPPDTLRWVLACAGKAENSGELLVAQSDPVTWPKGHRYETRYAPRTDPLLPEGDCMLSVQLAEVPPVMLGKIAIHQRERRFELPQLPQVPLDVTIGEFARFVGVDVSQTTSKPEDTFDVTLYAQINGTADRDYTVFVHLVSEDEQVWAQSDAWPERGTAPTTSWVAGQTLVDVHTLTLPSDISPGTYTLFVGLYDADRGGRVPLYNENGVGFSENRTPVATLRVVP